MSLFFDVPDSIPLSKVYAILAELGITQTRGLQEFRCGVEGVYVELWAEDENGRRYLNPDGKTVAVHRVSIPVDRRG